MILLSLWGPVVAVRFPLRCPPLEPPLNPALQSVGNLCTLVLVAIADTILSPTGQSLSKWTLGGSAMVCAAFAMLVVGAVRGDGGH